MGGLVGFDIGGGSSDTSLLGSELLVGIGHGVTVLGGGGGFHVGLVLGLLWLVWSTDVDSRGGGDEEKGDEFHFLY